MGSGHSIKDDAFVPRGRDVSPREIVEEPPPRREKLRKSLYDDRIGSVPLSRRESPVFAMKHPVVDLGIVCSDFDKSLFFYRDLLGMEVALDIQIPESTATGAGLAPSGFRQVRLRAATR